MGCVGFPRLPQDWGLDLDCGRMTSIMPRRCISPFWEDNGEKHSRDDNLMTMNNMYWLMRKDFYDCKWR